jgi:hypothetical protein
MGSMYAEGYRFCEHCGPPEKTGEWKPPSKIRKGRCVDCGRAVRMSPRDGTLKAIARGYIGQYSKVKLPAPKL